MPLEKSLQRSKFVLTSDPGPMTTSNFNAEELRRRLGCDIRVDPECPPGTAYLVAEDSAWSAESTGEPYEDVMALIEELKKDGHCGKRTYIRSPGEPYIDLGPDRRNISLEEAMGEAQLVIDTGPALEHLREFNIAVKKMAQSLVRRMEEGGMKWAEAMDIFGANIERALYGYSRRDFGPAAGGWDFGRCDA